MAVVTANDISAAPARAPVATGKVAGRRTLRLNNFDELLAEAERLAACETRTLGNWSLGQILKHLAISIESMIEGPPFQLPWPLRVIMTWIMKKRMLTQMLPAGFLVPKTAQAKMIPAATTTAEGLELLRAAVRRIQGTAQRGLHPAFGKMAPGEWDEFQLRHCEMHLSFVAPA